MPQPKPLTVSDIKDLWARSVPLWSEDDCAPDAERMSQALARLFPETTFNRDHSHLGTWDCGDAFIEAHKRWKTVVLLHKSYRGNNYIHIANAK